LALRNRPEYRWYSARHLRVLEKMGQVADCTKRLTVLGQSARRLWRRMTEDWMKRAIEALITRLEAIGHLGQEDRDALAGLPFRRRRLQRGEEIVTDGAISQHCCMVMSGYVYRSKSLANGKRQIFSLHTTGDVPDLHSLHLNRMDHNLSAMSDCEVALVPHAAVKAILAKSTVLTDILWRETLIDAAAFRAWILMLGLFEAPPRMAHVFCELYVKAAMAGLTDGNSFSLPITQTDLADVLGISVVHANRTLQELRALGLVEYDQQQLTILDWNGLRRLGNFDPAYLHFLDDKIGRQNPSEAS